MTGPTPADTAALTHLYQNMCHRADTQITLHIEDELNGLNDTERSLLELGIDIGWTATLEELADRGLLAGGDT
jgi:hypothetical protein